MPEVKYSFCRICECSCGLEVHVKGGRIEKIRPDREHVASRGYACKKGTTFHEVVHSPDRVTSPLKRTGTAWDEIPWRQALQEIGKKVRDIRRFHGPDSIAGYAGNGAGFSLVHGFALQGFMDAVGSRSLYSASSQDCSNKFAVSQHMYGSPLIQTFPDIDKTDCLIMLGANPAASRLSFASAPRVLDRLREIVRRGGTVAHINPRKTEAARYAGRHIPIRPDTDVFFLLAFAGELIRTGGVDHDRVGRHMKNYGKFSSLAEKWTPEQAEEVTGIPAGETRDLVNRYISAGAASLYCSTGINHGRYPSLCFWILEAINAVSGNLDRQGGTLVGKSLIDLPAYTRKSGILMRPDRSRVGGFPSVMDCFPGGILHDEILTPGKGQVRAFFISGGNPMLSFPDTERMTGALEGLELLVSVDFFRNETGNLAHYILPATTFMEHPDINFLFQSMMGIMAEPFLSYSDAMVPAPCCARDELWIYRELSRAAGLPFFNSRILSSLLGLERIARRLPIIGKRLALSQEKIYGLMLRLSGNPSLRKMRKNPHGISMGPNRGGTFLGTRVLTGDGLVDLAPEVLLQSAAALEEGYRDELANRHRLKLVNMRQALSHNSYMHNQPSLMNQGRSTNHIHLNPEDAKKANVRDGDMAKVTSETGSITIPVKVTEDMMPGAAAIPHGWGHGGADGLSTARKNPGANVNYLTPSGPGSLDRVSGMARLSGIIIEVEPVQRPAY